MLYILENRFNETHFEKWWILKDIKHPKIYFNFNIYDHLCIYVEDVDIPLYAYDYRQDLVRSDCEKVKVGISLFKHLISKT